MSIEKFKFSRKGEICMSVRDEMIKHPYLPFVQPGDSVIALKGTDYEGLMGYVEEVRYGDAKETETDCLVEIVVTYNDSDEDVAISHPHLNGTSICEVVMNEGELGFYWPDKDDQFFLTDKGRMVCPHCCDVMMNVKIESIRTETFKWNMGAFHSNIDDKQELKAYHLECNHEIPNDVLI